MNSWQRWQNLHYCYWFWTLPTKAGHLAVWAGSTWCSWAYAGESGTPSPESPCGVWRFLSQSAQAAITKYHRLRSLYNTFLFSIVLEAASPGRVRFWGEYLPGLQMAAYLLCSHVAERASEPWCLLWKSLSRVQLFATPWTIAHQAPLSMGFPRQESWSGCGIRDGDFI